MNERKITKKIRIELFVLASILFLITVFGLSYAYFTVQIRGNEEASSIDITAARLSLIYRDVQIVMGEYEEPGWTDTKVLTVENNGTDRVQYIIKWRELENTLTNDELVMSAACASNLSGHTCSNITEAPIASAPTEITDVFVYGPVSIDPGEIHTYTVTVIFKEIGSVQNYNQDKYFNGTLNIGQYRPSFLSMGTDTEKNLPVVRSMTIPSEEFYDITNAVDYSSLISSNGNIYNYGEGKTILLAKYNLYVGQNCTSSSSCTPISTADSKYGLQSIDAKGYVSSSSMIAVAPFTGSSSTNGYWYTGSALNSDYGISYNASNVYDTNYATAPNYSAAFVSDAGNVNYSIAYYVNEYINRMGTNATGRLLTYTEANAMTTPQRTNGTYYWLGSAYNAGYMRRVDSSGTIGNTKFNLLATSGVRPVLVINTADIQYSVTE